MSVINVMSCRMQKSNAALYYAELYQRCQTNAALAESYRFQISLFA